MSKKTLVLGASLKPDRYSNMAIRKLVNYNQETVAFGMRSGEVAGVPIDTELVDYKDIDTVTLYLNPTRQQEYYDYVVNLKPKRVIFNPGTENPAFYTILKAHNITFEVACTLVLLSTNQY
ncbi:CoA-binding protein [Olleya sp. YS]|uniref:CoA-binding protein n=1 Tax=Olleya sp. YS TaxID=3028318 RepID=UPI0024344715|nr:CoA-binding protein [Olleya sp. YS]WGD34016.1 CoA-binding protein [Olleya sp. YS]